MIIRRVALWAGVLFVGWIALMALVMRFSDAAPAAVVILPPTGLLNDLPGVALISQGYGSITVRDDAPALAARLYAAGAWLVLPAGLTGCLPLPKTMPLSG